MPIPKEILDVKPRGTVVKFRSNNYYVVYRKCVRKNGKNLPSNDVYVGKIENGIFVSNGVDFPNLPKDSPSFKKRGEKKELNEEKIVKKVLSEQELYFSGSYNFITRITKDLKEEMDKVFTREDVDYIYNLAILRSIYGGKARGIANKYKMNFMSYKYPRLNYSSQKISDQLFNFGLNSFGKMNTFMTNRLNAILPDSLTIIDGTLRKLKSKTSTLSQKSRKSRDKNYLDICTLYSFNLTTMEPVTMTVNPGNMIDCTAFEDFITKYPIKNGIWVGDKAFLTSKVRELLDKLEVGYLMPLKKNAAILKDLDISKGFQFVSIKGEHICGKKFNKDGRFYYAFYDFDTRSEQVSSYIDSALKHPKGNKNNDELFKKLDKMGFIVFESNRDISLEDAFYIYDNRWDIEVLFKLLESLIDVETVKVQTDARIYASEFINYLSLIINSKIKKVAVEKKLIALYSVKELLGVCDEEVMGKYGNIWEYIGKNVKSVDVLNTLELLDEKCLPKNNSNTEKSNV